MDEKNGEVGKDSNPSDRHRKLIVSDKNRKRSVFPFCSSSSGRNVHPLCIALWYECSVFLLPPFLSVT